MAEVNTHTQAPGRNGPDAIDTHKYTYTYTHTHWHTHTHTHTHTQVPGRNGLDGIKVKSFIERKVDATLPEILKSQKFSKARNFQYIYI